MNSNSVEMIFLGTNVDIDSIKKTDEKIVITFELEKEKLLNEKGIKAIYFNRQAQNRKTWNEILKSQFNALDLDKNGELSFDEIDEKIAYIDERQFNQLDKNKNGQLNYAEVQELFIIFIIEG